MSSDVDAAITILLAWLMMLPFGVEPSLPGVACGFLVIAALKKIFGASWWFWRKA
jgi:hypothetical protein